MQNKNIFNSSAHRRNLFGKKPNVAAILAEQERVEKANFLEQELIRSMWLQEDIRLRNLKTLISTSDVIFD